MLFHCMLGLTDQGADGTVCLKTAVDSAPAALTVIYQRRMTEFRAHEVASREQLPVQNDSSAHAGAERYHQNGVISFSPAGEILADDCAVGVISGVNRDLDILAQFLP